MLKTKYHTFPDRYRPLVRIGEEKNELQYNRKDNKITIENIKDFEPKHVFECGQAFRWYMEEDGFILLFIMAEF